MTPQSRRGSAGLIPDFPTPAHAGGGDRGAEAPAAVYRQLGLEGWIVEHKRLQLIWREVGLQRPLPRRRKRALLMAAWNSCGPKTLVTLGRLTFSRLEEARLWM
jgi:hypothetical protein